MHFDWLPDLGVQSSSAVGVLADNVSYMDLAC